MLNPFFPLYYWGRLPRVEDLVIYPEIYVIWKPKASVFFFKSRGFDLMIPSISKFCDPKSYDFVIIGAIILPEHNTVMPSEGVEA